MSPYHLKYIYTYLRKGDDDEGDDDGGDDDKDDDDGDDVEVL